MARRFGYDFSSVRVHADDNAAELNAGLGARAMTRGDDIWFGRGLYAPASEQGLGLLAHELTHVVQQRANATGCAEANETEARESAGAVAMGGPAQVSGAAPRGQPQLSALSDSVDAAFTTGKKGAVFTVLRERGASGPIPADQDLTKWLDAHFGAGAGATDDRWLADQIVAFGSEPHWPLSALTEREKRAHATTGGWAPEAGAIEGDFGVGAGRTAIKTFFFPGSTARNAMIIGGVHGSEAAGVQVVDMLLDLLRKAAAPPAFNLIVVPVLFPENLAKGFRKTSKTSVDPNRQMPAVGDAPGTKDSENRPIEPENLVLLDLIERFHPERIASVHGNAHAGMASVTSDPRPGQEPADNKLALDMAKSATAGHARVPGNQLGTAGETATYPTSSAPGGHEKGVTFGNYGSHAAKTRPAMNVVLIETEGNNTVAGTKKGKARTDRKIELESFATVLRDIFLKP